MRAEQRSFRLSPKTLALLDDAAERAGESRNALAERLLGEALRTEQHPLIRFRKGEAGRRQPAVVGTRLYVHQVVATARGCDGSVDETAEYLGVEPRLVRGALDYYADFREEVDADLAAAQHVEDEERARWERQQRALA
ncbi:MAG: hypothetical protein WD232_01285 [Acidimicrobiales bacterium]